MILSENKNKTNIASLKLFIKNFNIKNYCLMFKTLFDNSVLFEWLLFSTKL